MALKPARDFSIQVVGGFDIFTIEVERGEEPLWLQHMM